MTSYLQDRQLTIALDGEIDHHGAKTIVRDIQQRIDTYLPGQCILDFQDVTFMDSSGIAVVISAVRQMRQLGGRVTVRGARTQPMKVMHAAGLEKIVDLLEPAHTQGGTYENHQ